MDAARQAITPQQQQQQMQAAAAAAAQQQQQGGAGGMDTTLPSKSTINRQGDTRTVTLNTVNAT